MPYQETIGAGEFKTHCLSLMREAYNKKETIMITKRGEPYMHLVPYTPKTKKVPLFGYMKGLAKAKGNIYSTGEEWSYDEKRNM